MSLIQLVNYKEMEMRLYKMPSFENFHFEARITVASGLCGQIAVTSTVLICSSKESIIICPGDKL